MHTKRQTGSIIAGTVVTLLFGILISSCQPPKNGNANANANANINVNANPNSNTANANSSSESSTAAINTREPEKNSVTLVFSMETQGGEKAIGIPSLSMQVAKNSEDRRVEFKLPDGTPLVYLDHGNRHY